MAAPSGEILDDMLAPPAADSRKHRAASDPFYFGQAALFISVRDHLTHPAGLTSPPRRDLFVYACGPCFHSVNHPDSYADVLTLSRLRWPTFTELVSEVAEQIGCAVSVTREAARPGDFPYVVLKSGHGLRVRLWHVGASSLVERVAQLHDVSEDDGLVDDLIGQWLREKRQQRRQPPGRPDGGHLNDSALSDLWALRSTDLPQSRREEWLATREELERKGALGVREWADHVEPELIQTPPDRWPALAAQTRERTAAWSDQPAAARIVLLEIKTSPRHRGLDALDVKLATWAHGVALPRDHGLPGLCTSSADPSRLFYLFASTITTTTTTTTTTTATAANNTTIGVDTIVAGLKEAVLGSSVPHEIRVLSAVDGRPLDGLQPVLLSGAAHASSATVSSPPPPTLEELTSDPILSSSSIFHDHHGPDKLVPAHDVLARIRHDPALDEHDFDVGYEDRHEGIKELAAVDWLRDSTAEDFIPRHRIRYFKRRSDGVVMWDRVARVDRFG